MNKLLTLGLAGILSASLVSAEEPAIEDAAAETAASNFDGLYVGVGIGGSFLKNKDVKRAAPNGDYASTATNDTTLGPTQVTLKSGNYKANRFGGDIFVGYRKVFANNFALGAQFTVDFAKNQKHELEWVANNVNTNTAYWLTNNATRGNITDGNVATTTGTIENKAVTPELALTAGYAAQCAYFGVKLAAVRPEAKVYIKEVDHANANLVNEYVTNVTKIVPAVYLEAARAFGKWIVNVEAGYQFAQKKEIAANNGKTKFNQGWKVRAGVARSFNLF